MDLATLSPSPTELHLDGFAVEAEVITIQIAAKRAVAALALGWPEMRELERLAREFVGFFRQKDASTIGLWIRAAERTPLRAFARGLFPDLRAIRAAMELPWSNGLPEGHINRLKTLKRTMYGRAGFELLRARLLLAASAGSAGNTRALPHHQLGGRTEIYDRR